MDKVVHFIGFGSQGKAWAENLRDSGWKVEIFLSRKGPSYDRALSLEFKPRLLSELSLKRGDEPCLVVFATPDDVIGSVYREFLAPLEAPLTLVLIHGFAVYSNDLKPTRKEHEIALLAPKAIGPRLRSSFQAKRPHSLVAGFAASPERRAQIEELAQGLGFARERLVPATFEQEAIGDLISEQGFLCGGVFTLMRWTMDAMARAGVPDGLIREECITELELIASLVNERGPATAFRAISQAAQAGTVAMAERLERSSARAEFQAQVEETVSKRFAQWYLKGQWKPERDRIVGELEQWEKRFRK